MKLQVHLHCCSHHSMTILSTLLSLWDENSMFIIVFSSQIAGITELLYILLLAWKVCWTNNPTASDFIKPWCSCDVTGWDRKKINHMLFSQHHNYLQLFLYSSAGDCLSILNMAFSSLFKQMIEVWQLRILLIPNKTYSFNALCWGLQEPFNKSADYVYI